ncbi:aminotransferase class I/II-fold pyridoxal phosphate-dependent enzyme [Paenibacillus montanisoli]|uniref:aminotransferase class I/II-fold pyridoxal phosphate-dependent enzyme n=1 Tax=Paenibacillus montanisoli TaxID=2081970 RepID=UPI001F0C8879|nr:aminotransferase class I/II-fold pyridoxal phosphate-dependent enzyme [Paenibacillus montanisoli]
MAQSLNLQWHAPLFEALTALQRSGPASYHVPGHKYGQSLIRLTDMNEDAIKSYRGIMAIDVTELSITDDLHAPSGIIEEAQTLAANAFGADKTFFLVGGSTSGNLAMILAVCRPLDLIIVQRNAHKSVLNALKLAGARAVFMMPQRDLESNLSLLPTLGQVESALLNYPEAKAVFLTNPSYYGLSLDLAPYADLIHKHGKLLLVDEAHGAHYGLHPQFPRSAMQAGADAVVQSTHKTLPALTMGAMLHVQGERIDRNAIAESLRMVQSSSPSYPIMASLDITRAMLQIYGSDLFREGLDAAADFRKWVSHQTARYALAADPLKENGAVPIQVDPLRVVIREASGRLSGFELQQHLEKYGIYAEMADLHFAVLLFGLAASVSDVEKLQEALTAIANEADKEGLVPKEMVNLSIDKSQGLSEPIEFTRTGAKHASFGAEIIALADSEGRFAAEAVIPYPPGIPILYEGERISAETIHAIQQLAEHGARCQGATDPTMRTITVLRTG